jgi:hypothetical protein
VRHLADVIVDLGARGVVIEKIYGRSDSKEGARLMNGMGFTHTKGGESLQASSCMEAYEIIESDSLERIVTRTIQIVKATRIVFQLQNPVIKRYKTKHYRSNSFQ